MGNLVGRDEGSNTGGRGSKSATKPVSPDKHSRSTPNNTRQGSSASEAQTVADIQAIKGGDSAAIVADLGPNNELSDTYKTCANTELVQEELDALCDSSDVPMVFRWEGGGKNVYITGTFNKWKEKIPMHRSGNDFTYIHELQKGKHAFKFIVDDEWRFAPEQPTVADNMGFINNFVDLTDFDRSFADSTKPLVTYDSVVDDAKYDDEYAPDPDDPQWYTKEPPNLPPHLRNIILNAKGSNTPERPNAMQTPQHVTLNHLYCSAIKDNLMVLGVTQRFRKKFITTVFYSPLPEIKI
mmetsp:Transcript_2478/g.2876  ORF Transcript_2478/g.2876 Transcript_2478/m.2876 type:complete len:296 (+) Transcript_2478:246-1133(+)